ncbi:MAG: MFS transporter, partial [Dehalococcoidia bacterium]
SSRARWLLIAVAAGVFVAADDQTAIVTVLPPIIDEIGLTVDDFYRASWVVNAYLLGYIVALPIVGRVADVYGHARIFAACLGLFMLGSALVAVSPSFTPLVLSRALQAVGGGGVVPVAMAIVVTQLPPERRLMGLGAIAAASEGGALLGPLWGGGIAEFWGWRMVFWINLPMTLPIVFAVWRLAGSERVRGHIDWTGAAILGATLSLLTFALVDDPNAPRPLAATLAMLALAAALFAAFIWHERRTAEPIAPLRALRERHVLASNVASFLVGVGLITALIGVPLFVNLVLVEGALAGGLTLMRLTVAVPLGAFAGGWLGARLGLRATAVVGMTLAAAGFLGLQAWDRDLSEVLRSGPQLLGGFGFGLVIAPLAAAVLQRVDEAYRASASAWLTLARVTGMLVGAALLTSTGLGRFYARAGSVGFDSPDFQRLVAEAQVTTFREVFIAGAIVMLLAA